MNQTRSHLLSVALVAMGVSTAAPALAEDVTPADAAAAKTLLEAAAKARDKNDFATCRDQAKAAWQRFHHAQIAGLMGLCEVELGQYREGATHLADFLSTATEVPEEGKKDARAALAKAKVHLAEVALSCTPPGVELFVDGQSVGNAPVTVYVEPGEHLIEAKKEHYEPGAQKKSLLASTEVKVEIVLTPLGPGERSHKPVWPYVLGGSLAAAGLGVGIAGTVVALGQGSQKNDLAQGATCRPVSAACLSQGSALAKKQGTFQTVGTTGFLIGGAALVATLVYLAVPAPRRDATETAHIEILPVVHPSGSGLWIDGSF